MQYLKLRPMKCLQPDDWLTTYMVARLCKVSPRSVTRWCDDGTLKCQIFPGGRNRRIQVQVVTDFMNHHGFPVPPEMHGYVTRHIMIATQDAVLLNLLASQLPIDSRTGYRLFPCQLGTVANELLAYGNLDVAVVDWSDGLLAEQIVDGIEENKSPWLIELLPEDNGKHPPSYKATVTLKRPVTSVQIIERIRRLCEGEPK